MVLNPVTISRSEKEQILIEPSINSVRINIKIKQQDHMERIIAKRFASFMMQRAEKFAIMRRKALPVSCYTVETEGHTYALMTASLFYLFVSGL